MNNDAPHFDPTTPSSTSLGKSRSVARIFQRVKGEGRGSHRVTIGKNDLQVRGAEIPDRNLIESPVARVFYISLVFSNARRVLSQCSTRLRLLYLLNISMQRIVIERVNIGTFRF